MSDTDRRPRDEIRPIDPRERPVPGRGFVRSHPSGADGLWRAHRIPFRREPDGNFHRGFPQPREAAPAREQDNPG